MKRANYFISLSLITAILAGCQSTHTSNSPSVLYGKIGTTKGAAHYHAERAAEAPLGALSAAYGNALGRGTDPSDHRVSSHAFEKVSRMPVGEEVYWHNARTGHWGTYCPVRDGLSQCGNYCREFVTTTHINGRAERTYGTACRRPNGTWYLM